MANGTISFSKDTDLADKVATDGDAGSTDISGIAIDVYPITSSGTRDTAQQVAWRGWDGYPSILVGVSNGLIAYAYYGMVIKSQDGSNFSLTSLDFFDWGQWYGDSFSIQGFNNGVNTGSAVTFNGNKNANYIHLAQSGVLTSSKFQNVDEVRIFKTDGTDSWTALNNIQIADPVTPAPTVSSIAITSATGIQNSTLNAGDVVSVTVTMSAATTVTGHHY
jgi:hypothetical protein